MILKPSLIIRVDLSLWTGFQIPRIGKTANRGNHQRQIRTTLWLIRGAIIHTLQFRTRYCYGRMSMLALLDEAVTLPRTCSALKTWELHGYLDWSWRSITSRYHAIQECQAPKYTVLAHMAMVREGVRFQRSRCSMHNATRMLIFTPSTRPVRFSTTILS